MTMAFGFNALGQELPPAAIWVGLPMGHFEPEHFKEIGKAVKVDCKGKHLSRYGRSYRKRDGKCYQWQRSELTSATEQSRTPSFCFVVFYRDEKLISSDNQPLLLLSSQEGALFGVSNFPDENTTEELAMIERYKDQISENATFKMHKYQPISLIDCETRERLNDSFEY